MSCQSIFRALRNTKEAERDTTMIRNKLVAAAV